jgi:DNA-binding MarR family transcriptional regulator
MSRSFARLYSLILMLEEQFGLSSLEKDERAIFYWIVERIANDETVYLREIAASGLTSRPSVYRHVRGLEEAGLIEFETEDRRSPIHLAPTLSRYEKSFTTLLNRRQKTR